MGRVQMCRSRRPCSSSSLFLPRSSLSVSTLLNSALISFHILLITRCLCSLFGFPIMIKDHPFIFKTFFVRILPLNPGMALVPSFPSANSPRSSFSAFSILSRYSDGSRSVLCHRRTQQFAGWQSGFSRRRLLRSVDEFVAHLLLHVGAAESRRRRRYR